MTEHSLVRSMRNIANALTDRGRESALVGGLAVSARVDPRFTQDVDLAVSIGSDVEAERLLQDLRSSGYRIEAILEQTAVDRLATARLIHDQDPDTFVDLLFASSGIEAEIVASAEVIEVFSGVHLRVASIGHLIATKLLAVSDRRPRDRADLLALSELATARDMEAAQESLKLIAARGYNRGKDLDEEWRALEARWRQLRIGEEEA